MKGIKLEPAEILEMKVLSQRIWKGRSAKVANLTQQETETSDYKRYINLLIRYFNHNQNNF